MNWKHSLLAGAAIIAMASCQDAGNKSEGSAAASRKLLDPANMDTTIRPGDDFFMYANGTWLKNNPIPGTETRWGSFNELQENNFKALHELLDAAAANKNAVLLYPVVVNVINEYDTIAATYRELLRNTISLPTSLQPDNAFRKIAVSKGGGSASSMLLILPPVPENIKN